MKQRTLTLTPMERAELEHVRARDPRPYLREKAAALLKITDGMAPFAVARQGLLRPRHPETIYLWLNDYEKSRALAPQPARRRRLFSPAERAASGAGADDPSKS